MERKLTGWLRWMINRSKTPWAMNTAGQRTLSVRHGRPLLPPLTRLLTSALRTTLLADVCPIARFVFLPHLTTSMLIDDMESRIRQQPFPLCRTRHRNRRRRARLVRNSGAGETQARRSGLAPHRGDGGRGRERDGVSAGSRKESARHE